MPEPNETFLVKGLFKTDIVSNGFKQVRIRRGVRHRRVRAFFVFAKRGKKYFGGRGRVVAAKGKSVV